MLNATDWPTTHPDFFADAQLLLARCQDCLEHMALIANDTDALDCLLESLSRLAEMARQAEVDCTARLCRDTGRLIAPACAEDSLRDETRALLGECLTLLAWQLELIDPNTGLLPLDQDEQRELLDKVAASIQSSLLPAEPAQHRPHCEPIDLKAVSQAAAHR